MIVKMKSSQYFIIVGAISFVVYISSAHGREVPEPEEDDENLEYHYRLGSGLLSSKSSGRVPDPIPPKKKSSFPYYVSASVPELHDQLYRQVIDAILTNGTFFNEPETRTLAPFKFTPPEQVGQVMDYNLPEQRTSHETLLDIVNKVLELSPRSSHPYKVDRHSSGLDPYGLVGDWLGTILNVLVIVYHTAPVFTLMEYELERKIRELVGYPEGKGDGVITHGAGLGNGYVIQLALQAKFPEFKDQGFIGIGRPKPTIFVSEHGNFVFEKHAVWQGLGSNAIIRVKANPQNGRMDLNDLQNKIQQSKATGQTPVLVVATAGTTILGAIDPLESIAKIAKENEMWFHVDGQIAGSAIFSTTENNQLKGAELSDSFIWSADKGLAAPFVTTVLVSRHKDALKKTFSLAAPYVFRPSRLYNNTKWDNGDHTLQCTRRPDIVKIWFMIKAKGQRGLGKHVDYTLAMTETATNELKARQNSGFEMILENFDSPQVAFYYVPQALRQYSKDQRDKILAESLYTERLKALLLEKGQLSISVNNLPEVSTPFFVMSLFNSALTPQDVTYILDLIAAQGEDESISPHLNKAAVKVTGSALSGLRSKSPVKTPVPPTAPGSYPSFVSAPIKQNHEKFLREFFELVLQNATYLEDKRARGSTPPHIFLQPEDLLKEFDFSLNDDTVVGTMEEQPEALLQVIKNIIKYSVFFSHPLYNYQLSQGLDPYSVMADYTMAAVNSPMITYEDNPLFTQMEIELTRAYRKLAGYPRNSDGISLPGGSPAIQLAMLSAFITKYPEAKTKGMDAVEKPLVVFISDAAHYASDKGSFYMGLGTVNCRKIDIDENGHMSLPKLKAAIKETIEAGKIPLMAVATAGTTVMGVFDRINDIADICEENNMWLHVDGSYGGSVLFSANETRKAYRFTGIERSDSFNTNPHKVFGAVRESGMLITRHANVFSKISPQTIQSIQQEFNNQVLYDSQKHDSGRHQFLNDRRANVFKNWFMWKAKGFEGMSKHVDQGFELTAQVVEEVLRRNESFHLANYHKKPESAQVNLYYIPERLRHLERDTEEFYKAINPVAYEIVRQLTLQDRLIIANKKLGKKPSYLVLSLTHTALSFEDAKYMLDLIEYIGQDVEF